MKKIIAVGMMAFLMLGLMPQAEVQAERGGLGGLLVGCCFGIRTTGEWNEGKDLHFRDWGRIVPIVNIVLAVWDGIQGAQGITTSDLAAEYGSTYF